MPGEIIVLKPNGGTDLTLDGPYSIGLDLEWGDHVIEPSIASGPDIVGGIVGTRQRITTDVEIPVRVKADTSAEYVEAAEALVAAATRLARFGGTLTRQVNFPDGTSSEEVETEILACNINTEDGWLQPHRLTSVITLNIVRNPAWLLEEELLASDSTYTDSVKRLPITARGNLPGPGRIVLTDNDSTARRFAEIGGAFEQDPQEVEFLADDFTLSAGTLETDADAIGGEALEVTPVLPVWTTVGILEGLPHAGSYRIRLRLKGGEDDSQFTSRVVWRSGSGPWKELRDRVETPDAENFYDLDAGAILRYDNAETMDVRVDVRSSAASSETYSLNGLTITPSPLYVVASGTQVEIPSVGAAAFDDFATLEPGRSLDNSDGAGTNRTAPEGGGWLEAGTGTPEWARPTGPGVTRRAANDSTSNIGTGQYAYLSDGTSATTYDDVECVVAGSINHNGVPNTETILGALVRFVDANNWLMAAIRHRRKNDGTYTIYIEPYKRVAGTITRLGQITIRGESSLLEAISVSATAAGDYEVRIAAFGKPLSTYFTGSDAALAPAGALEDGKVGMYSLIQSTRTDAYTTALSITGYGNAFASEYTDIVRDDGIGVFAHDTAYSAESDSSDPQNFQPQGPRIWIPPGAAEITAKVRSSQSETQPDEGAGDDTGIAVYHRPGFASLTDALEA